MKYAGVFLALVLTSILLPAQDYELNQRYLSGPAVQHKGKSFVINDSRSKAARVHKKVIWGTYRAQQGTNSGFLLYSLNQASQLARSLKIPTFQAFNGLPGPDAKRIKKTSDGGYIMIGTMFNDNVLAISTYVLKVDRDLNFQWSRDLVSNVGGSVLGEDILQSQGGEYIMVGRETTPQTGSNVFLAKLTPWGTISWQRAFDIDYADFGTSITESTTGDLFISGGVQDQMGENESILLLKTNGFGIIQWVKNLDLSFEYEGEGTSISYTELGGQRLYFCGYADRIHDPAESAIKKRAVLVGCMDTQGNIEWVNQYGGAEHDIARHIRIHPTKRGVELAITGSTESFGVGGTDQLFFQTNSTGDVLQALTFGGDREDLAFESQQDHGHQSLIGQRGIVVPGAPDQSNISIVGFNGNRHRCGLPFLLPKEEIVAGDTARSFTTSSLATVSTPASLIPLDQTIASEIVCGTFLPTRIADSESEVSISPSFSIFPNPSSGHAIQLRYEVPENHTGPVKVTVCNQLGQVVHPPLRQLPNHAGSHEVKLPLGDLPPGLYRISLEMGNEIHHQELVKQ